MVAVFPTTPILDNFTRADANPLDGGWSNGWKNYSPLQLQSGNAAQTPDGSAYAGGAWYNTDYGPDCEIYLTLDNIEFNNSSVLGLRQTGDIANPDGGYILSCDSSRSIALLDQTFTLPVGFGDGYSIGFSAIGNVLTAYYQPPSGTWQIIGSPLTDINYPNAGKLAIALYGAGNNTNILTTITAFGGGTVTSSG